MNHAARPLAPSELPTLHIANPDPRIRALLWTGLCLGLRIGEIVRLDVKHVLAPDGRIRSEVALDASVLLKQGASRSIPMNPILGTVLNSYFLATGNLKQENPLFRSEKAPHQRLSRRQAMRLVTDAFKNARLDGSLPSHALRKTFANAIHQDMGHDLARTQLALGHASPASTIAYLESADKVVREAIRNLYLNSFTLDLPFTT